MLPRAIALAIGLTLIAPEVARATDPLGVWITEGGEAKVRIVRCGHALCGRIVALREPRDPSTGHPKTDENNRDVRLRGRPLIGVQIAVRMTPTGKPWQWAGHVYNPDDGGLYPATLTLRNASSLRLEGCMIKDVLCDGQTWTRAR